jgi:hypothetical protein
MCTFYELKSPNESKHSIFRKTVFINRSLIFIDHPKFYAAHLGVKITGTYIQFSVDLSIDEFQVSLSCVYTTFI